MVGQIVHTYQRKRFSPRKNGAIESQVPVSEPSADSNKHIALDMTKECAISCVHIEEEVGQNFLQCENGSTQFVAQHIEHDKKTQDAEPLENTEISTGPEEMSPRSEGSASGTDNRWSSRLLIYGQRSKQVNKKSAPATERALTSKKIKVDDHPRRVAERDPSAALQILQNSVPCEARTCVTIGQIGVQDNYHPNHSTVKPIGSPIDSQNRVKLSLCTDYNRPVHYFGSEGNDLTRASGVHLSLDLTHETKMANQNADFIFRAEAVYDETELSDSGEINYLQLFPESRNNGTTLRANARQQDSALTGPHVMQHQFKQPAVQSASPYDPSWNPAPERPGTHKLTSSLLTMWTDTELDSLWVGVRRHGRGNWETILSDPRLHFRLGRTPQDLAVRWEEELITLERRSGYQNSGPVNLLSRRVGTHPYESNTQLQYPGANTAAVFPYYGMPQVASLSHAHSLGTLQQPGSNINSSDSIGRQAGFQTDMRACSANPPPVIGHPNVGMSDHCANEEDLIVFPDSASSEKTSSGDGSDEH